MSPFGPSRFAPPPVDPYRTRQAECKHCRRPIVYVTMEKTGGKMPCDPTQHYGDGQRTLVERIDAGRRGTVGRVHVKAPETILGLEPHFGTCPVLLRKRAIEAARKDAEAERAAAEERATAAGCTIHRLGADR
ncbi:MAG: hypothetical protein CMM84_16270 [Rhodothermaceae bacterium]|nr:hypothetical protein [Rhodothermaceae bacterium]